MKNLAKHKHNIVPREANITQEMVYVKSGSMLATIFDKEISSDLRSLAIGLEESNYDVQIITTKNGPSGSPIALKIGGSQADDIAELLEKSAAPLRTRSSNKAVIIRYR